MKDNGMASGVAEPIRVDTGDLVVGDVVKLSGRGPVLTVVATAGNYVRDGAGQIAVYPGFVGVQWFDATGNLRSAVVPVKSLKRHEGEPGSLADGMFALSFGGWNR